MNPPPENDLLGYVLGALDAQEQRDLQKFIDANPHVEDDLLAIKNALNPLEYLDNTGSRPGLARRTCELVANLGQAPIRRLDPSKLDAHQIQDLCQSTNHGSVASVIRDIYSNDFLAQSTLTDGSKRESLSESVTTTTLSAVPSVEASIESTAKPNRRFSNAIRELGSRSPFSLVDMAVGVGFLAILAGVLLPAISHVRFQSRIAYCQNNLQLIGRKLIDYTDRNGGQFIQIPTTGRLAVTGAFAPLLKESGFVEDDSLFSCAGAASIGDSAPVRIPSVQAIQNALSENLIRMQQSMSGHFGYTMRYESADGKSWVNQSRPYVMIMADLPSSGHDRISINHARKGQNCLFEDGHVQFVSGDSYGEDLIYVNEYNLVAPGCRPEDNVISPSHLSPHVPARYQPAFQQP